MRRSVARCEVRPLRCDRWGCPGGAGQGLRRRSVARCEARPRSCDRWRRPVRAGQGHGRRSVARCEVRQLRCDRWRCPGGAGQGLRRRSVARCEARPLSCDRWRRPVRAGQGLGRHSVGARFGARLGGESPPCGCDRRRSPVSAAEGREQLCGGPSFARGGRCTGALGVRGTSSVAGVRVVMVHDVRDHATRRGPIARGLDARAAGPITAPAWHARCRRVVAPEGLLRGPVYRGSRHHACRRRGGGAQGDFGGRRRRKSLDASSLAHLVVVSLVRRWVLLLRILRGGLGSVAVLGTRPGGKGHLDVVGGCTVVHGCRCGGRFVGRVVVAGVRVGLTSHYCGCR